MGSGVDGGTDFPVGYNHDGFLSAFGNRGSSYAFIISHGAGEGQEEKS